jgi:hypothetical protein
VTYAIKSTACFLTRHVPFARTERERKREEEKEEDEEKRKEKGKGQKGKIEKRKSIVCVFRNCDS